MPRRCRFEAVTFDCWQTLIFDDQPHGHQPARGRVDVLCEWTQKPREQVASALAAGWAEHQRAWHRRQVFAGPEITRHVLAALDVTMAPTRVDELVRVLEDEITGHRIVATNGAREILEALRADGVRVALICDTGFSPGRVVRQLLERVGLLEFLEVQIFSDEIRVPKPHPRAFHTALQGLDVDPQRAAHVGDLRRSDIAGARDVGMTTVRFAGLNDDADANAGASGAGVIDCISAGCNPTCPRPEAHVVITSYNDLATWLATSDHPKA